MANADFLVTWPATTGTAVEWTLSHRTSTGEFQPVLASTVAATSTNVFYTLVPSLSTNSTNSPFTVVSYLRHLAAPANYVTTSAFGSISRAPTGFIYASSTIKPNDPAVGASLTQHNQVTAKSLNRLQINVKLIHLSFTGSHYYFFGFEHRAFHCTCRD